MVTGVREGDRVRVELADPSTWATGAPASLEGRRGTVERVAPARHEAGGLRECPVLVRFDEPAPPWSTNQRPPAAWHFGHADLVRVRGPARAIMGA